jgi:transcriptional regulator with XRE-family HTH domain
MITIGDKLRQLREEKRVSLYEMSQRTGLQRGFIRRVENNLASPSLETLERFANALHMQLWQLFYTGDQWQPPQYLTDLHELAQERAKAGLEARFFLKLRPFLARIPMDDRLRFLSFAKALATHRPKRKPSKSSSIHF